MLELQFAAVFLLVSAMVPVQQRNLIRGRATPLVFSYKWGNSAYYEQR